MIEGRISRIARLRERLAQARTQTDHPDGSVSPTLFGAHQQLLAFIEFAEGDPECRDLISESRELQRALLNISKGRSVDWLTPQPRSGPPPLEAKTANLRGRYAAVMQYLMGTTDLTEKDAANFVVRKGGLRRELSNRATKRANSAPDWKIICNWRQRAIGPPDPSRHAEQSGFNAMLALIKSKTAPGAEPQAVAREMLRALNAARRGKPI
jgi:hypothetical protein